MTQPAFLSDLSGDEIDTSPTPKDSGVNPSHRPKLAEQEAMGPLLDEKDEGKVFAQVLREWKRGDRAARNRNERNKRNQWWRQGKRFARLIDKQEDVGLLKATLPPGMSSMPPMPNKVDDLCRKIVSQLTVDPAAPEVEPKTDSDGDKGAAEFATRFLKSDGGESGTDDARLLSKALDKGTTAGCDYLHVWIDPNGGGWRPREIKAHPLAVDAENPLVGAPQPDPMTGQEMPAPYADPITRYATKDGQITDKPIEADRQWLPKLKASQVPVARTRLLPETVTSFDDISGIILCLFGSLGDLRSMYETEDEPWGDDFVRDLVAWKPPRFKELLPAAVYKSLTERDTEKRKESDGPDDDTVVFHFLTYRKSTPLYPEGAIVAVNGGGDGVVLFREPWSADVEEDDKGIVRECLPIPVVQVKQMEDVDGDPHGVGVIEKFGAADEQRAMVLSAWNEFLDIHLHPNTFVTSTTPVQPKQLALRDGTPIVVNQKEDMPFYEPERTFPPDGIKFLELITHDMDSASGLDEVAQGVDSPNVQSGIHARQVIEQSLVALGDLALNATSAMQRFWRIKLQLARAKMTVPQLMGYVGDDGAYKQEYWTGADFTGTKDVAIARGTGTMMSPSQKQEWIMGMVTPAAPNAPTLLTIDEARDMIRSGIQATAGLEDNPHMERVKRQIAAFMDGPAEGFTPAQPSGQVDPMSGQPVMTPPSFTPFDPRPNDEEPAVAAVRHRELTKSMAGSQYAKQPAPWRTVFDAEYTRMAYAAGIVTMRQQAQAQQQAQSQAQQQAADQHSQQMEQGDQASQQKLSQSDQAHRQQMQQQGEQSSAQLQMKQQQGQLDQQLAKQKAAVAANRQATPA